MGNRAWMGVLQREHQCAVITPQWVNWFIVWLRITVCVFTFRAKSDSVFSSFALFFVQFIAPPAGLACSTRKKQNGCKKNKTKKPLCDDVVRLRAAGSVESRKDGGFAGGVGHKMVLKLNNVDVCRLKVAERLLTDFCADFLSDWFNSHFCVCVCFGSDIKVSRLFPQALPSTCH